jgi:DeoR/GlpR family transcriptional regulator of sugar metabolism
LDKVDVLITDEGIRPEQIRELEDFGMRVVIAAL